MKKIIAFLLLFAVASCSKFTLSKTIEDFPNKRWEKKDIQTFEFTIEDDITADVAVLFSHVSETQYDEVPLAVTIQDPTGKKETIETKLLLKDPSGKELSDCVGDVCDLATVLKEGILMQKGTYIITLQNETKLPYLPNVLAVGITIETVSVQ